MCLQAVGLMWPASTLPFTICHNPHYRERIGTAPVLSSPSFTPTAISALQQSLSGFLPPAHLTFIFHFLHAKHLSDAHAGQSKCNSRIRSLCSLYSTHPCFFQFLCFLSLVSPEHSFPLNSPSISPTMPH